MAQAIVMPKLGNTVESAILLTWHVAVGESIAAGEPLCEIETDKAALEVESTVSGVLLAQFFEEGDEVPVLENIAAVGQAGESFAELMPATAQPQQTPAMESIPASTKPVLISPRAKNLARRKGIDYRQVSGSGPNGRIIERDIEAAIASQVRISPVAMLAGGEYEMGADIPVGSRVTKTHLAPARQEKSAVIQALPLRGIRKTIAKRMLESAQTTAQLTLNVSADATALVAFRRRLKNSDEDLGLRQVNINDLLMYVLAQTLPDFPALNAVFENETLYQHQAVSLGMAVDTRSGLMAPVIRHANSLSLRQLSAETHRLALACREGIIRPEELSGGSFTMTNLGGLGIESFTPLLNPPQVAILGAGSINLKPMPVENDVAFVPHIGFSLTINHQVVDGAPAARFLAELTKNLARIDLLLAG